MSKKLKALIVVIFTIVMIIINHTKTVSTDVGSSNIKIEYKSEIQIEAERLLNKRRKEEKLELQRQQELLQKQQEETQMIALKNNTTATYNPNNLRKISNASPQLLYNMMNNTAYQSQEMVDLLIKCEDSDKPINAVFLLTLMKIESKSGTSQLSRANNNIASIRTSNGWKYFDSFEECLKYLINLISNYYLDSDGSLYKGTDIWSINKSYCPNDNYEWSKLINQVASEYDCVQTEN